VGTTSAWEFYEDGDHKEQKAGSKLRVGWLMGGGL